MKKPIVLTILLFLTLSVLQAQSIDAEIQAAVYGLASRLLAPLQVSISPITMSGTDAPSEFSRFLFERINYYAGNTSMFRVIQTSRGPAALRPAAAQPGTITGTFSQRGDTVEVFLNLVIGDEIISPQRFSVPVDEIRRLGVAIEPENQNALVERERVFTELARPAQVSPTAPSPARNNINIYARFNSDTMTYRHREELKIWLTSDRDCYFKVIHIDVNNEQEMIYPNTDETDNRLYAGRERVLFQKNTYRLYPPYGTDTILIIASSEQFPNIELDYITPIVPLSANSIREAVTGYRGGQYENTRPLGFTGSGEARYNITILKPHEEFTLFAPANMAEAVSILGRDVESQRGFFEGTDVSGYYILNGIRASYRAIPSNNPQTIEYAVYYENAWRGTDTRARETLPLIGGSR